MARESENLNRGQQALEKVLLDYKNNKKIFIGTIVTIFILSIISMSWIIEYSKSLLTPGQSDAIPFYRLFIAWTDSIITIIFTLAMFFVLCSGAYRVKRLFDSNYIFHSDEDENYKEAKAHTYGFAHFLRGKELKEICVVDKNFDNIHGDILGKTKNGELLCLKEGLLSFNWNKLLFGASGAGKSSAYILNDVIQLIRRGESIIITDTKGDIYRDTAAIAKKNGYLIRILNIKPDELKNSDAWDPLKYISIEDEIQAEVLARAIIENTMNGPMDYWANNEMNALKGTLLLVATTEKYKDNRSMSEVINIFAKPESFNAQFAGIPDDHPAKICFNIFVACKADVQGQILNGMGIRLTLLQNKYVKNIISHDEIDLILPMKRKCLYYIVIPDTESTTKFLASMFFTQCFSAQVRYADSLSREQKKKELIPVRYELDEAKSIGKIPDFDKKISTFRSRKITSLLAFQNKGQLESLYPKEKGVDGNFEDILANSATQILVKGADLNTCKYFEDVFGQLTVIVDNAAHEKSRTQIKDLHDGERVSEGVGQRPLRYASELMKMKPNDVYIEVVGYGPIFAQKYICEKENPIYLKQYEELEPNKHIPKWRKALIKQKKEADALLSNKGSKKIEQDKTEYSKPKDQDQKENAEPLKAERELSSSAQETQTRNALKDTWKCPECGEMNYNTDKTCINCGHKRKNKKGSSMLQKDLG